MIQPDSTSLSLNTKISELTLEGLEYYFTRDIKGPGWDSTYYKSAEKEYRRFLNLAMEFPKMDLIPGALVDYLWRIHEEDEVKYKRDCQLLFGYCLIRPNLATPDLDLERARLRNAFSLTKIIYHARYGSEMPSLPIESKDISNDNFIVYPYSLHTYRQ